MREFIIVTINSTRRRHIFFAQVKQLLIKLDGKQLHDEYSDGFLLRRAPGSCHYDFVQEINFLNPPTQHFSDHISDSIKSPEGTCHFSQTLIFVKIIVIHITQDLQLF